jgi:hypothetical protein
MEGRLATMSPLDYLLQIMRDPDAGWQRQTAAAAAALPYCHARLNATATIDAGDKRLPDLNRAELIKQVEETLARLRPDTTGEETHH